MYCSSCGTPVTPGLSFCNRCGASLKERIEKGSNVVSNSLTAAVVLVAIFGLGIMFGGAIALRAGGGVDMPIVAFFMLMTFAVITTVEVMLLKQLSRVLSPGAGNTRGEPAPPLFQPSSMPANEFRVAPLRVLPEPVVSVTENTTRTLEHALRESLT